VLRALARLGYEFVPDTTSIEAHDASVSEAAAAVRDAVPALVSAFGGSPATALLVQGWMDGA
jgi:hypothetical protein